MIAQELHLLKPSIFASLTLISSSAGRSVPPMKGLMLLAKGFTISDPLESLLNKTSTLFPQEYINSPAPSDYKPVHLLKLFSAEKYCMGHVFMERELDRATRTRPAAASGSQISAVSSHYVSAKRLEQIKDSKIPVLVVAGSLDILMDVGNSKYLANALNANKLVIYPDCGHSVIFQKSNELNILIKEFIGCF